MSGGFRRTGAILIKEAQDISTNLNLMASYALSVLLAIFYSNLMNMSKELSLGFGLLFLVVMVGMNVSAMLIAEEKEKNTIGVLLLSPATPAEVFLGKGLLTLLSLVATMFVLLLAVAGNLRHLDVILAATVLTSITCILLGMVVGLLAQNQMATYVIGIPLYLLFMLVPLIELSPAGKGVIAVIAKFFPTYYYAKVLEQVLAKSKTLIDLLPQLGALAFCGIVSFVALLLAYRRKGLE